jgi:hypothetical protein
LAARSQSNEEDYADKARQFVPFKRKSAAEKIKPCKLGALSPNIQLGNVRPNTA